MPKPPRPPMPKLPPFALAEEASHARRRPHYLLIFFLLFTAPLLVIHSPLLSLPYFWDEHGQFIPTALDILRDGAWVAHSTLPNVHPPGVEAYLALSYKLFGYSIPVTRVAMLILAGFGLLITFLLAIELSRGTQGAPAFLPPLFLLASPLFYTQSMMAQLDMPAMVFTLLALYLFITKKFIPAALASTALVLVKETGLIVPFVFFLWLVMRRQWRCASYFIAPALALAGWLLILHQATHFWLGNPDFARYNVSYSLHPVRIALSILRRIYYIFFAEFRWIVTAILLFTARRCRLFGTEAWRITWAVTVATVLLVSLLGGAELERYLLPILPVLYIAAAVAATHLPRRLAVMAEITLLAGLTASLFWNPPYPFPYENNLAMVDFVRLQQSAAAFAEHNIPNLAIATAWPFTAALANPDYGFVHRKFPVRETNDFHVSSIRSLPPNTFDALITYTRTWAPANGIIALPAVQKFLARFYEWEPDITSRQCQDLGLTPVRSFQSRGQQITIYLRSSLFSTSVPAPSTWNDQSAGTSVVEP